MDAHVATSPDIAKGVARALRCPVPSVPDNLLLGPCALDAAAHVEARCAAVSFDARAPARLRRAYDALQRAVEDSPRLVVWTAPLWRDRLMLWALCAWRAARGGASTRVATLSAASSHAADIGAGSLRITAAEVRDAEWAEVPGEALGVLHRRWEQITAAAPVLAEPAVAADLVDLGHFQAGFLPQRRDAALALSRTDALLFACLGESAKTPVQVLMTQSPAGDDLRRLSDYIGDIFVSRRLAEWSRRGALDAEPHRPDRLMNEARYRVTMEGWSLVREGLKSVSQGPPLPIWGMRAYDPAAPWVVTVGPDGANVAVVRLAGAS
jgi:hypothetical protein